MKLSLYPNATDISSGTVAGVQNGATVQYPLSLFASATDAVATFAPIESPTFTGNVSGVTAAMVGLGNVNNTSDANKPPSTATQIALDLKAPLASPTFSGNVSGITAGMVGLGNVNNTADIDKPVSHDQQTALNLKAPIASPTFTGTVFGITADMVGLGNVDNTPDNSKPVSTAQQVALNQKANIASPTFTGTVSGITAAMVGLGNVNNTSDANKPISAATQNALDSLTNTVTTSIQGQLDLKAPLASPAFTGTVSGITSAMVGLGNVNNTSDADKPISTAVQSALNLLATFSSPTITTPTFNFGVGASSRIYAQSANTGYENSIDVYNSGTVSNTGTRARLIAEVGSGYAYVAMEAAGGPTPFALISTGSALTGGLSLSTSAGPINFSPASGISTFSGTLQTNGIFRQSSGQDTSAQALFAGLTKAVRISTSSTTSYVEGTDQTGSGSYQPLVIGGSQVYIGGTSPGLSLSSGNAYLNFNNTVGSSGYGLRDNSGVIEAKRSGGAWDAVITRSSTDTLTNKTLTSPSIASATITSSSITSPTGIVKGDVGLGNVDNTSDANKPVSTAQQAALDLKANLASPTFTGTVSGITATMVGLGNVTNTSDANKPVSTAQQTALDLKSNLASPTFTGTATIPTANITTRAAIGPNYTINQYSALIGARGAASAFEFGNSSLVGYGSVLGSESTSGLPFLAFNAGPGTNSNTYKTLGIAGSVFRSDNSGGFVWANVANVNADNQALTSLMTLSSAGVLNVNGQLALTATNYVGYSNFTGAVYGTIYYDKDNTGYYVDPASTSNMNAITGAGVIQSNASLRAPIFYDSANTGYYIQPRSSSRVGSFTQDTGVWNYSSEGYQRELYNYADSTAHSGGNGGTYNHTFQYHGGGTQWLMYASNFYAQGNIIAYWSDRRLKENLEPISDWRRIIDNLTGYRFNWNEIGHIIYEGAEKGKIEVGLIAQDVREVYPEAVAIQELQYKTQGVPKDGINYDPDDPYITIQYDKLIPVLVQSSKAAHAKLDDHDAKLDDHDELLGKILERLEGIENGKRSN